MLNEGVSPFFPPSRILIGPKLGQTCGVLITAGLTESQLGDEENLSPIRVGKPGEFGCERRRQRWWIRARNSGGLGGIWLLFGENVTSSWFLASRRGSSWLFIWFEPVSCNGSEVVNTIHLLHRAFCFFPHQPLRLRLGPLNADISECFQSVKELNQPQRLWKGSPDRPPLAVFLQPSRRFTSLCAWTFSVFFFYAKCSEWQQHLQNTVNYSSEKERVRKSPFQPQSWEESQPQSRRKLHLV